MHAQLVCRQLQAAASWCVMRQICPKEGKEQCHLAWPKCHLFQEALHGYAVEAVEDCAGTSKCQAPPDRISRSCQPALDDLTDCMDAHQESDNS